MKPHYKKTKLPDTAASDKKLFTLGIKDILAKYKKHILGIEIGVLNGETSKYLLGISKRIRLVGIDPLNPDSVDVSLIGTQAKIDKNVKPHLSRFTFLNDYSGNVVGSLEDNAYHFIFIDGAHHYSDVKSDFELYFPKIKKSGLIYLQADHVKSKTPTLRNGSGVLAEELIKNDKRVKLIGTTSNMVCFQKL